MATHVDDVHKEPEDQRRLLAKLVDHPRGYEHLYYQPARAVYLGVRDAAIVILFGLARWTANKSRKYHCFTIMSVPFT